MVQKTNTPISTTISSSSSNNGKKYIIENVYYKIKNDLIFSEVTELSQISHINTQKPHQGGYYTSGDTTHYYSNKTPFTSDASHISATQVSSIVLLLLLFLNLCNKFY